jgi:hypothetical protein
MNTYRIYLADGTDYVTSMNATLKEARAYFGNRQINRGTGGEDNMVKVRFVYPVGEDGEDIQDQSDDSYAICPYCKAKAHVEAEEYDVSGCDQECCNCGKTYFYETEISVTHRTYPL